MASKIAASPEGVKAVPLGAGGTFRCAPGMAQNAPGRAP
jgi:hypothetical protein